MKIVCYILLVVGLFLWLRPRTKAGWVGLVMAMLGAAGILWNKRHTSVEREAPKPSYPDEEAWARLDYLRRNNVI